MDPNTADLLDVQSAIDNQISKEEEWEKEEEINVDYHTAPHQLAAMRLREANLAAIRLRDANLAAELQAVVASHRTRRENATLRLQQAQELHQSPIHPTSSWMGDTMNNASPITTSIQKWTPETKQNGLHVLELFGGIGLGVLRCALASGHQIRCYTYVDKDDVSRRVAATVLRKL